MPTDKKTEQPIPGDAIPTPVAAPAPAPAPVGPKKTAEEWAKAKGMFHEFTEGKRGPKARPKSKAPQVHNPKFVHFHRARHSNGWPIGMELTEAEFEQAIAAADAHVYR
jgi:hypothetical protein